MYKKYNKKKSQKPTIDTIRLLFTVFLTNITKYNIVNYNGSNI